METEREKVIGVPKYKLIRSEKIKFLQKRSFVIYRAKSDGSGFAAQFQYSVKDRENHLEGFVFLIVAKQGDNNAKGDATFDWKNGINVKLSETDIGDILAVLSGRKKSLGFKGSIYHESEKGNKIIKLDAREKGDGYNLSVSFQDLEKKKVGPYYVAISHAEAEIIQSLLRHVIVSLYGWR